MGATYEVLADTVRFLPGNGNGEATGQPRPQPQTAALHADEIPEYVEGEFEEEIP